VGEKLDNIRKKQGLGAGASTTQKIEAELKDIDLDKEMDVIGSLSNFKGEFCFGRYTRIEGKIEGKIKSTGILILSSTSEVKAEIKGRIVVIDGKVAGNINAEECVVVQEHGLVTGNIKAPNVEIDPGATINGSIFMGKYHTRFVELESGVFW
jgi:cytoskeletal protein CcmA (bactofilin family)